MPKKYFLAALGIVLGSAALTTGAEAQMYTYRREDAAKEMPDRAKLTELAKMLQNPIANLIQLPFLNNFEFGIGDASGFRYRLDIDPSIPISITRRVMMISKTEIPIIAQNDLGGTVPYQQGGLGDVKQSFYFTPRNSKKLYYGAGPIFLLPTATDKVLGTEKWAIGPTGMVLTQTGPWTFGMLSNYLISYAGDDDRPKYSKILLQPFAAAVIGSAWAVNLTTQTTYDFSANRWNAPLIGGVTKVMNVGQQTWGFGGQMMVAMANPNNEPDWGFRTTASILFPGRELATRAVARTAMSSQKPNADVFPQVVQSTLQASQLFPY